MNFRKLTGADHKHRESPAWIEDRLAQLVDVYAVSIWAYAVMSNHLHLMIEMHVDIARSGGTQQIHTRHPR